MKKIKPTFKENVSETLLIPLYMRAKEAEEKNPIIVDEVSQKILAKIDYNFNKFSADKRCQFCISVRTKYFDEILRNFVAKYDDAVVVLLACGLDPRIEDWGLKLKFQSEFYYFSQHFSQMYKRLGIKAFILKYLSKYRRSIGIWSYRKAG